MEHLSTKYSVGMNRNIQVTKVCYGSIKFDEIFEFLAFNEMKIGL